MNSILNWLDHLLFQYRWDERTATMYTELSPTAEITWSIVLTVACFALSGWLIKKISNIMEETRKP